MPRGSHQPANRIFSHKQKVAMMKATKERRAQRQARAEQEEEAEEEDPGVVVNEREGLSGKTINPLRSRFELDPRRAVEERQRLSQQPLGRRVLSPAIAWDVFLDIRDGEGPGAAPIALAMPGRPAWHRQMGRDELEEQEQRYFRGWLRAVRGRHSADTLNYYERNVEVWRQLWRVLEQSDVVAVVGDARFPALHLPASLYKYVTEGLRKPILYILNKVDLVPASTLEAWREFLATVYPGLRVLPFTTHPHPGTATAPEELGERQRKFKGKTKVNFNDYLPAEGAAPPRSEAVSAGEDSDGEADVAERRVVAQMLHAIFTSAKELHPRTAAAGATAPRLRVGMVGHPNVGKSSIINCLKGEHVVSTSSTPGHTKHLQTINVGEDLAVYDCPGLVFPSLNVPRPLQVVCGLFPVAQCRDPCSAVRYLCERLPLEKVFKLRQPSYCEPGEEWSAWTVCEAYAEKKGFFLRKGKGRPDTNRAAQAILKEAVEGQLTVYTLPPQDPHGVSASFHTVEELPISEEGDTSEGLEDEEESEETAISSDDEEGKEEAEVRGGKEPEATTLTCPSGAAAKRKEGRYTRRKAALEDSNSEPEKDSLAVELSHLLPRGAGAKPHRHPEPEAVPATGRRRKDKGKACSAPGLAAQRADEGTGSDAEEADGQGPGAEEAEGVDRRECHAVSVVRMAADGGAEDVSHRLVPVRSFAELPGRRMGNGEGLAEDLVAACRQGVQRAAEELSCGPLQPTPIQAECWAALLVPEPPDIVAVSPTGSGKTLAYLLPVFASLVPRCNPPMERHLAQPQALVVVPTRELCQQVRQVASAIVEQVAGRLIDAQWGPRWSVFGVAGGGNPFPQRAALLAAHADLLVGTPGRLLTFCGEHEASAEDSSDPEHVLERCLDLTQLRVVVLDEADRLLDLGFHAQTSALLDLARPATPTTVLTTATWPAALRELAAQWLRPGALRINVGGLALAAAATVRHGVEAVPGGSAVLRKRLVERVRVVVQDKESVLVFVTYRKEARDVARFLTTHGISAAALHGEMPQTTRQSVLDDFTSGRVPVLVATDVAARGLDVPSLRHVILCSPGVSVEQYVHRVGRCGRRPGVAGEAHTFVTDADAKLLPQLVPLLQRWKQTVPPAVLQMMRRVEAKAAAPPPAPHQPGVDVTGDEDDQAARRANQERQRLTHAKQVAMAHQQQKGRKGPRR